MLFAPQGSMLVAILKFTDRSTVIHAWLYAMGFDRSAGRVLLLLCGGQVENSKILLQDFVGVPAIRSVAL